MAVRGWGPVSEVITAPLTESVNDAAGRTGYKWKIADISYPQLARHYSITHSTLLGVLVLRLQRQYIPGSTLARRGAVTPSLYLSQSFPRLIRCHTKHVFAAVLLCNWISLRSFNHANVVTSTWQTGHRLKTPVVWDLTLCRRGLPCSAPRRILRGPPNPWRRRRHVPSKRQESFNLRHSVTSQKTGIDFTVVKTSKLAGLKVTACHIILHTSQLIKHYAASGSKHPAVGVYKGNWGKTPCTLQNSEQGGSEWPGHFTTPLWLQRRE
jgi:hypothetical protein